MFTGRHAYINTCRRETAAVIGFQPATRLPPDDRERDRIVKIIIIIVDSIKPSRLITIVGRPPQNKAQFKLLKLWQATKTTCA